MNRRSFLAGASTATLAALAAPRASGAASLPLASELDDLIESARRRIAAVPGLAVAVYSRDGIYARGFGVTDVTTNERADADTAFYIASSTKPLTALALASMAERGGFSLDARLAAFAPDAPFPAAVRAGEVTFRNLLTHTSGIACDPISIRVAFSGQHDPALLWRLLAASRVNEKAPLGTFEYTNTGYNIATVLTDRRFGRPWQDLLDAELFGPAGMTRASARMSRALARGKVAKPHIFLPTGSTKIYLEKTDATMQSAGGVVMSANDAARWLELMIEAGKVGGRRVLPERAVLGTREPFAKLADEFAGYTREAYGLGWYHGPHRDERMLHHFGGFAGARAHVSYIPARNIGVAAFANEDTGAARLTDVVANYVYDRTARRTDALAVFNAAVDAIVKRRDESLERFHADRAKRAARTSTLTRPPSAYVGVYENAEFGRIEIKAGQGLEVVFGVMRSLSEPAPAPDAIRVELLPFSGELIAFEGAGASPAGLRYHGELFKRL